MWAGIANFAMAPETPAGRQTSRMHSIGSVERADWSAKSICASAYALSRGSARAGYGTPYVLSLDSKGSPCAVEYHGPPLLSRELVLCSKLEQPGQAAVKAHANSQHFLSVDS